MLNKENYKHTQYYLQTHAIARKIYINTYTNKDDITNKDNTIFYLPADRTIITFRLTCLVLLFTGCATIAGLSRVLSGS